MGWCVSDRRSPSPAWVWPPCCALPCEQLRRSTSVTGFRTLTRSGVPQCHGLVRFRQTFPKPSLGLAPLLCIALRAITTSYQQSDSPILVGTRLSIGQGDFPKRGPYLAAYSQDAGKRPRTSTNRKQPPNGGESHDETKHRRQDNRHASRSQRRNQAEGRRTDQQPEPGG